MEIEKITIEKLYRMYKNEQVYFSPKLREISFESKQALLEHIIDFKLEIEYIFSLTVIEKGDAFEIINGSKTMEAIFDFLDGKITLNNKLRILKVFFTKKLLKSKICVSKIQIDEYENNLDNQFKSILLKEELGR